MRIAKLYLALLILLMFSVPVFATLPTPIKYWEGDGTGHESLGNPTSNVEPVNSATINNNSAMVGTGSFIGDYNNNKYWDNSSLTNASQIRTIDFWYYPENFDNGNYNIIEISKDTSNYLFINKESNDQIRWRFYIGGSWKHEYTSTDLLNEDEWNHVVITFGTGGGEFWLNNVSQSTNAEEYNPSSDWTQLCFGNGCNGYANANDMRLDNVAFFEQRANDSFVAESYLNGLNNVSFSANSNPAYPATMSNISLGSETTSPYSTNDTTPTFSFDTDIAANCKISDEDQNYSTMSVNCTSGQGSETGHICTLHPDDELYSSTDYVYIACETIYGYSNITSTSGPLELSLGNLDETNEGGLQAGIDNSDVSGSATVYDAQQVYLRNVNGDQVSATVDKVVISGSQRWLLNVVKDTEPLLGLFNITPVIYVYDVANVSNSTIAREVSALINSTYTG